jgi:hypothetical protein
LLSDLALLLGYFALIFIDVTLFFDVLAFILCSLPSNLGLLPLPFGIYGGYLLYTGIP